MFNLQGSEIIIVLLLALVVLGPEKLPDAMRKMGQAYAELKKMSSGFQSEFRSAIEEPMREVQETANVLRDSADFTKLQAGERDEKPKSAAMAPADPSEVPTEDTPTFETASDAASGAGPDLAAESKSAPFSDESAAASEPAEAPDVTRTEAGDDSAGGDSAGDAAKVGDSAGDAVTVGDSAGDDSAADAATDDTVAETDDAAETDDVADPATDDDTTR